MVKGWYCRYSRNCSVTAHLRAKNSSLDEWYLGSPPSILSWRRPPGGTARHLTPEGVWHPVLLWRHQFPAGMVSGNLRRQVRGRHASHLQFLKCFQGIRRKFYFLGLQLAGFSFQEIIQGFGYLRVAFDEPSEESCHPGKTLYFGILFWRSHIRYRVEVSRTRFHPLG